MSGEDNAREQSGLAKASSIGAAVIMGWGVMIGFRLSPIAAVVAAAGAWGFAMNLGNRAAGWQRLLALIAQVLGLLGAIGLVYVAMMFAEGGKRGYDVIPWWAALLMYAVVAVIGIATLEGWRAYREAQ